MTKPAWLALTPRASREAARPPDALHAVNVGASVGPRSRGGRSGSCAWRGQSGHAGTAVATCIARPSTGRRDNPHCWGAWRSNRAAGINGLPAAARGPACRTAGTPSGRSRKLFVQVDQVRPAILELILPGRITVRLPAAERATANRASGASAVHNSYSVPWTAHGPARQKDRLMWLLNPQVRFYLCTTPVDLTKSLDRLSGLGTL